MPLDISFNPSRTRASLVFANGKGNVITDELVGQMRAALDDLFDLRSLRLVTIEGAGPDFSYGASVPEHTKDRIGQVLPAFHDLLRELVAHPAPTMAVVRGRCLGGGFELALACDAIVASETATFGLPEIALGVFPPAGSVLLPLRAGLSRAAMAVLAGESRPAESWRADGVVAWTSPVEALAADVDTWFARTLARHSAEALRHAVRAVRAPVLAAMGEPLAEVERLYLQDLCATEDAGEGVQAFLEKRAPRWKDE